MVNKKDFILKHERILSKIYRLLGRNKIHAASNNELKINNAFLKRCCISIGGHGNCILGGIPAKIIKSGITWKAQRISTTTL